MILAHEENQYSYVSRNSFTSFVLNFCGKFIGAYIMRITIGNLLDKGLGYNKVSVNSQIVRSGTKHGGGGHVHRA